MTDAAFTWMAAGVALAVVEALAPGAGILWVGAAAALTGLLLLALPGLPFELQMALFAAIAIASVALFRARPRRAAGRLNNRADLAGSDGVVEAAFAGGRGRVAAAGTSWPARGPDLPAGAAVRIVAVADGVLDVEPRG